MGDRGGTATSRDSSAAVNYYTRWEIGGEPQQLANNHANRADYTRWEIGGEPQRKAECNGGSPIIPDGRSGGNRNQHDDHHHYVALYPMGDRGGTATQIDT